MTGAATDTGSAYRRRVDDTDWAAVAAELADLGCALLPRLLTVSDARKLIKLYDRDDAFRSTVTMRRHGFGEGEYRYLAAPLPEAVDELRHALYPHLLPIARDWYTKLGRPTPWPDTLDEWLQKCHRAGQTKPTPLILKYGPGDWNALHRDLYGELVFPLQVVINLTDPGKDYTGGEFLLVEQRPRAQSRGTSATLPHLAGDGVHNPGPSAADPARLVGRADATRCVDAALRAALHPRHPFPRRPLMAQPTKTYTLLGANGKPYRSPTKGTIGGHRGSKIFGRLDCPSALRAIERGGYIRHRVFFADPATATKAGYRPCAVCRPDAYRQWKDSRRARCSAAWPSGPRTPPRSGCPGRATLQTS